MIHRFLLVLSVIALTCLVGCSDPNKDPYEGWKDDTIYQEGRRLLDKEDFSTSIKAFESLQAQFPFGKYTEKGDLELIYAYYRHDKPELAIMSAERFIRLYPNSTRLDYAYYMLGIVYYANGRTLFQRYLPYDLSYHDLSDLLEAYSVFKALVEKYPSTPYKNDALRRMLVLRNVAAAHELETAEFYLDKKAYVAVIHHAHNILLHYPNTPAQERALEILYTSYTALHSTKLSDNILNIMALNFPNNELLKQHPLPTTAIPAQQEVKNP